MSELTVPNEVDTSIVNLLTERFVDWLSATMVDGTFDETAAGLLRAGKLQDDPTIKKINILIREGGSAWPDILIPAGYTAVSGPQNQIGGGDIWLRRFVATYEMFFFGNVSRSEARRRANVIFSRLKNRIKSCPMDDMMDTFGEGAILQQVDKLETFEEGGPGTWVWRGTHYFEVMTETLS